MTPPQFDLAFLFIMGYEKVQKNGNNPSNYRLQPYKKQSTAGIRHNLYPGDLVQRPLRAGYWRLF